MPLIMFVLVFGTMAYFYMKTSREEKYRIEMLDNYGIKTRGIIFRVYDHKRRRFTVKNVTQSRFEVPEKGVFTATHPVKEKLDIGDTLVIEYYSEDPSMNRYILPDELKP